MSVVLPVALFPACLHCPGEVDLLCVDEDAGCQRQVCAALDFELWTSSLTPTFDLGSDLVCP